MFYSTKDIIEAAIELSDMGIDFSMYVRGDRKGGVYLSDVAETDTLEKAEINFAKSFSTGVTIGEKVLHLIALAKWHGISDVSKIVNGDINIISGSYSCLEPDSINIIVPDMDMYKDYNGDGKVIVLNVIESTSYVPGCLNAKDMPIGMGV